MKETIIYLIFIIFCDVILKKNFSSMEFQQLFYLRGVGRDQAL